MAHGWAGDTAEDCPVPPLNPLLKSVTFPFSFKSIFVKLFLSFILITYVSIFLK